MGMIDLAEVARLDEARLAIGMAEIADFHREILVERGGGVMTRSAPGTWGNTSVALGMRGPVTREAIDELIEFHEAGRVEPRTEVCPFADATLLPLLAERGFVVRVFENVFFREISAGERVRPVFEPPGVRIEIIDPGDERLVDEFARVVAAGFSEPQPPNVGDVALTRTVAKHPRTVCVVAMDKSERIIGGGAMEASGPACALFMLAVTREYRRRGVQQALVAARLNLAANRGARIATISSRPGVATERNARRMGFQVAYTKIAMVRPGAGLVPNAS